MNANITVLILVENTYTSETREKLVAVLNLLPSSRLEQ